MTQWRVYEVLDTPMIDETSERVLRATFYAFSKDDALEQASRRLGIPVEWLIAEQVVRTYQVPS